MSIFSMHDVCKRFGSVFAVDALNLCLDEPGVVALLGPNGAGKTTTIDMLLGLRKPTSGTVRVFDADPAAANVRRRVGCAPQQGGVPESLLVREILEFAAAQYPDSIPVAQALSDFGLTAYANRQAGVLSGGELRRLTLALAFIGKPALVFLDEPSNGLDLEARRRAWEYIRAYASAGGAVLLTTHHMEEAQTLASRIVVMNHGRVVRDGSAREIRGGGGLRRIVYAGEPLDAAAYGIRADVSMLDGKVVLTTQDSDAVIRALVHNNVAFADLSVHEQSLEDAVLSLLEEPV